MLKLHETDRFYKHLQEKLNNSSLSVQVFILIMTVMIKQQLL